MLQGTAEKRQGLLFYDYPMRAGSESWQPGRVRQFAVIEGPWKLVSVDGRKSLRSRRVLAGAVRLLSRTFADSKTYYMLKALFYFSRPRDTRASRGLCTNSFRNFFAMLSQGAISIGTNGLAGAISLAASGPRANRAGANRTRGCRRKKISFDEKKYAAQWRCHRY